MAEDIGVYIPLEIDIKLKVNGSTFVILCDGEAFHGARCIYTDPIKSMKLDEYKSRLLYTKYPIVLRYSESEINNNFAINHLIMIVHKVRKKEISNFYRNWMIKGLA